MYAIVCSGGKQYRVKTGDLIKVEKLEEELGSEYNFKEVLCVGSDKLYVGQPTLDAAKVTGVITQQAKGPKIIIFKKKRRQGYRKLRGHRQTFTEIFVKSITSPEGKTDTSDTKPPVKDPVVIAAKKKALKEDAALKASTGTSPAKKTAKKKTPVKKAAAKKTAAKKKVAKKTAKKKTAKKATKKTT